MNKLLRFLSLAALCLASTGVRAEIHVLLVGVSEYPTLAADQQLKGPGNDVRLMRDLLVQRGIQPTHVRLLTEGQADGLPTRANILKEIDAILARVREGDEVFMLFAGHGSQQPAADAGEPDGLDEIFLPRDIGVWKDDKSAVENAISDNHVRDRVRAMREKGAFVWAVFDSCHSATMTRGLGIKGVRYRNVDPSALGIKPGLVNRSSTPDEVRLRSDAGLKGGDVGFYAAQTTELAPETDVETGAGSRPHGVFTWALAKGLQKNGAFTYRQLGQYVLQSYSANGFRSPTPLFEGSALDRVVLGGGISAPVDQWPLATRRIGGAETGVIPAGLLDELRAGDEVLILPDALSSPDAALGKAAIASVQGLEAVLASPQGRDGKPLAWSDLLAAKVMIRRATAPGVSDLSVALASSGTPSKAERKKLTEALGLLKATFKDSAIRFVDNDDADLLLHVEAGRLYLAPRSGLLVTEGALASPSIGLADLSAEALAGLLTGDLPRIARATNLLRLASAFPGDSALARGVQARLLVRRDGSDAFEPVDMSRPLMGRAGDELKLEILNHFSSAVDITVLYVDATWGIAAMYPFNAGETARVEAMAPGAKPLVIGGDGAYVISGAPAGAERVLVIAVPAVAGEAPRSYAALEQQGVALTRGPASGAAEAVAQTRGQAPAGSFEDGPALRSRGGVAGGRDSFDVLVESAVRLKTRGVQRQMPRVTPAVTSFSLQVAPAGQ